MFLVSLFYFARNRLHRIYQAVLRVNTSAMEAGDTVLLRFIDVAKFTGMRLSEVAQIGAEGSIVTVDGIQCLKIRDDAKTAAGSGRLVPMADTPAARVPLQKLPSPPNLDY